MSGMLWVARAAETMRGCGWRALSGLGVLVMAASVAHRSRWWLWWRHRGQQLEGVGVQCLRGMGA